MCRPYTMNCGSRCPGSRASGPAAAPSASCCSVRLRLRGQGLEPHHQRGTAVRAQRQHLAEPGVVIRDDHHDQRDQYLGLRDPALSQRGVELLFDGLGGAGPRAELQHPDNRLHRVLDRRSVVGLLACIHRD